MLPAPPSPIPDEDAVGAASAARRTTRSSTRVNWLLAGTAVVGCAYVALADPNSSASWYPQCPFKTLTGYDCPGCGVTRALHAGLTGHPLRALDHNAFVIVMGIVALAWFVLGRVRTRRGEARPSLKHPTRWAIAFGVALISFWVLRNVPWGPFEWLGAGAAGV